ncbi:MAG: 1-acyl-sn-glycerol-3-phosphate acyltransferase [Succinivibrio sp.]|nr:1-acyl-sn-glycerol-3-phosphate acyltransferase [Succinivibrio sp.]
MLAFLPSPLLLLINLILVPLNSVLCALPILILGLLRPLRLRKLNTLIDKVNYFFYRIWVWGNTCTLALTNRIDWRLSGDELPALNGKSCVVMSNHLSWADIIVIGNLYRGRIPITKFFMKHSLIYIPVIGLACYALGMPFLRRYTKEQMLKDPSLKTRDLETTNRACRSLVNSPSSLINFVEGTRYTQQKAAAARSPYRHLMPPKCASLAVALGNIGKDIDYLFNTTIIYPENHGHIFADMFRGRLKVIYADIRVIKVTPEISGDYLNDKVYKHSFTMQVRKWWEEKDAWIDETLREGGYLKDDHPSDGGAPAAAQAGSTAGSETHS